MGGCVGGHWLHQLGLGPGGAELQHGALSAQTLSFVLLLRGYCLFSVLCVVKSLSSFSSFYCCKQ